MFSQSLPGLGGFPPAPPVLKKITKAFQKGNYTESDGIIALYKIMGSRLLLSVTKYCCIPTWKTDVS